MKAHVPTDNQRSQVSALVSFGNTQEEIATYLRISIDTLQRRYQKELASGLIEANAKIASTLFKAAEGGDVKAMMFWLKTRARWRTTDPVNEDKNLNSIVEKLIDKLVDH